MADTVDSQVIYNNKKYYVVRLTNRSDGTGESAVVKVDISALTGPKGVAPSKLIIDELQWTIQGFTSVQLLWDAATDDEAAILTGTGYRDYSAFGGLQDPRSATPVGDLLLTTYGAAANATYDILIALRMKA